MIWIIDASPAQPAHRSTWASRNWSGIETRGQRARMQLGVTRYEHRAGNVVEQHQQRRRATIRVRDEGIDLGAEPGPDERAEQSRERRLLRIGS